MARVISAALEAAILDNVVQPFLLAKVSTSGGDVRVWTGIGDITFNSEVYVGVGTFGGVSSVQETTDLKAAGITLSLSGVPSYMLSVAIGQVRQGLPAIIYFGAFDTATGAVVVDPYELFRGSTDVPEIDEGAETSTINLSVENRLIDLERPRTRRYTKEDQAIDDPSDMGFDFVPSLQDKEVIFGRA